MVLFRVRLFLFVFAASGVLLCTQASAANAPEPPPLEQVIDPQDLSANWWNYFLVKPEELPKRIAKTQEMLQKIKEPLRGQEGQEAKHALYLIQRIEISLRALPETLTPTSPIRPVYEKQSTPYRIQDLAELGRKRYSLQEKAKGLNEQVSIAEKQVSAARSQLDTAVAAYINLGQSDPSRLNKGLEIISAKLDLVSQEYLLKLSRDELDSANDTLAYTNQEIVVARERLSPIPATLQQLHKDSVELEDKILKQQQVLYEALNQLNIALENQDDHPQIELARETLTKENIVLTALKVQSLQNIIMRMTFQLFEGEKDPQEDKDILNYLPKVRADLNKYQTQSEKWEASVKFELSQRSSALVNGEKKDAVDHTEVLNLAKQNMLDLSNLKKELYLSRFLLDQLSLILKDLHSSFWDQVQGYLTVISIKLEAVGNFFHQALFKVGETPITLWSLCKIILIAVISYLIAKGVQFLIRKFGAKTQKIEPSAVYTLSRVAYYFIFYIGLFIAISSAGIELTAIAFVAGAITFWIGLGLVPLVTNMASGIFVLLDKNIRKGDVIELESGEIGKIAEMNVNKSVLFRDDGKKMIIPNSEMMVKKITNYTLSVGIQTLTIPFEISSTADEDQVKAILLARFDGSKEGTTHKKSELYLVKMDRDRLYFKLKVWIRQEKLEKDQSGLFSHYLWGIRSELKKHNIPL